MDNYKSGFVNIIGLPNVGKSSLINFLINDELSIVTSKSQTTRQNIRGFLNSENYQIVLVDTPGWIENPAYLLQVEMNKWVDLAFEEGDIIILVVDKYFLYNNEHIVINKLDNSKSKIIVCINKIDQCSNEEIISLINHYRNIIPKALILSTSTLQKTGKEELLKNIIDYLPIHPPYFDTDEFTDKNTKYFCSEIIREKIFNNYQKEIPYSCEVIITKFNEKDTEIFIESTIYVERESQKNIIIGNKGEKIKKVSIESRESISKFLDKSIHLFLFVKVLPNWRQKENLLKRFGYYV